MSTDEMKRKTVCLKLAKNGIYLCKNPSNVKFVPSRDVTFGLKHLKEYSEQSKSEVTKTVESTGKKQERVKKGPEEETVLQKFIRGFDCGDYCDDSLSSGYSSSTGECSTGPNLTGFGVNADPFEGNSSNDLKQVSSDNSMHASNSRHQCRVEFITPAKVSENSARENVKHIKPLIVDLSQKKILLKDNPIKIVKSTPNELRQLNRNFITPKVKVENFSHSSDSSSLPLIISPAETPNFSGCSSSRSPYPSTKIEIDYTGSSIQDNRYMDSDFPRPIKSEMSDYGQSPKMIFSQDNEFCSQDNDGFDDAYRTFNNMIQNHTFSNASQQQSFNNNMNQHQSYNYNINHNQSSSSMNHQSYSMIQQHQSASVSQQHQSSSVSQQHQSYSTNQSQSYNNMSHHLTYNNVNQQSYGNVSHPQQSMIVEGLAGSCQADVMKAAKALYSKRTRTLFHWINPNMPKTKLKDSVMSAWDMLPFWQKQIYVNQVIGKCGNDSVSPMINPLILDINGMAEVVMSSINQTEEDNVVQPVRKKRKYTRKSAVATTPRPNASSLPFLSPSSSVYNFLSSL